MVHIMKFRQVTLKLGPLEDILLYRALILSSIVIFSVFIIGFYGLLSIIIMIIFLFRINDDFLDQYLIKIIKGDKRVELINIADKYQLYEIFSETYGYSEFQDREIISKWTGFISTFKSDILIIRFPYRIPIENFKDKNDGYNSLFDNSTYIGEAYFIGVFKELSEDFENKASVSGLFFRKLEENEVKELDGFI
ncbi:MAG: hypothetical protein ACP5MU_03510 [Thermoplasmata archaeon]